MRTIKISTSVLAFALLIGSVTVNSTPRNPVKKATTKAVAVTTLDADPAASTINWTAKKVGGQHTGTVKLTKGSLQVNGKKLVGGNFVMDMTTITDLDITNEEFNKKLTGHLKSEDFFSVEKNPTSTFKITKAAPIAGAKAGEANYTITGDLTIKGITNPITFPATVKVDGANAEASAKVEVDRIKHDIKFRSSMLGTAADKIIDDIFVMDIKLVAGKSKTAKL
ncbi:YceI family protein [Adhaeribacter radiodurans]|uniref:YceI family protein n=1 Tax=Adhaeribacter radiodurans TaxID=2745197 RepID=A0A7L7LB11_9BACT|nr:YceI family protein [Adhaeribacter radiodurans]QMU30021.1 YceI family protein [Adhaeribacter radiodurans]